MTFRWHRTSANLLWEKTKNWLSSFWHKPANKQTNKQSEKVNPVGEATGKVSNADNNLLQPLLTLELVRGSAGLQQWETTDYILDGDPAGPDVGAAAT